LIGGRSPDSLGPRDDDAVEENMASSAVRKKNEQALSMGEAVLRRRALRDLTDSQVVQAFLDGEQRAFGELVRRYDNRLVNFVYRTVGDRERAQDLVQETFVRVYRHLHRFDQTKKFSTWIYTIAGNLAKNELRNRSRNPLVLFQTLKQNWDADHRPLEWEDTQYKPDDLYRKRFLREKVEEAVAQLPEHHRVVFVLRELQGKTYEEIAEITGCNLGTVKSRLNRARNNFAQIIAPMVD
jgi:RNA polymerase sigma-70 factor (ECF subfamily)